MFYKKRKSRTLRFGDVLKGYCLANTVLEKPALDRRFNGYDIVVDFPLFSVVMSPCCQIERGTVALSPLTQIRNAFFDNPYLAMDFTRINRMMTSQQSIPPKAWKAMSLTERQKREAKGLQYAFPYLFVFEKNVKLPEYTLKRPQRNIKTGYYMVDFKNITKINCKEIKKPPEEALLKSKILELSVSLNDKHCLM